MNRARPADANGRTHLWVTVHLINISPGGVSRTAENASARSWWRRTLYCISSRSASWSFLSILSIWTTTIKVFRGCLPIMRTFDADDRDRLQFSAIPGSAPWEIWDTHADLWSMANEHLLPRVFIWWFFQWRRIL